METLNTYLFELMGAGFAPDPSLLALARWTAVYAIWTAPLVLLILWWQRPGNREELLTAVASGGLALAATEVLAAIIAHPRPFMMGLSPLYIPHTAEGSFPSAHASLMLAIAGSLLITRSTFLWGASLTVLGAATAWARVYLGLHFPMDILGSALVASVVVAALGRNAHGWLKGTCRFLEQTCGRMLGQVESNKSRNTEARKR